MDDVTVEWDAVCAKCGHTAIAHIQDGIELAGCGETTAKNSCSCKMFEVSKH